MVCFSYPFCICLIRKERYYQLPSLPTRGHGLILLLFWTLTLINEALAIVNLGHEDWWFHLKKYVVALGHQLNSMFKVQETGA